MIALTNVKKSYGDVTVLKDISFEVAPGEKVSLLGPGGCGKTTILKVLLGLELPDEGKVSLRGTDMVETSSNEKQETLTKVGMAFQQGALFDYMTVEDNLYFAMEHMTKLTKDQMAKKIESLLAGVKLGKTAKMYPFELSGGMQRRVGIARALATSPEVAIFDEPTSGLDPVTSTIILNMINDLVGGDEGHTSLISTTNVEIGIRYAKRVIVVAEGIVLADGPWRELLLTGPEWVRHFLSTRLIGLDYEYALELDLPKAFIEMHWKKP
jgi:phospholipid/cholesterol/gamma-HCH transport system ATP-binding protein